MHKCSCSYDPKHNTLMLQAYIEVYSRRAVLIGLPQSTLKEADMLGINIIVSNFSFISLDMWGRVFY